MKVELQDSRNAIVQAAYAGPDLTAGQLDHPAWATAQAVHITRKWSGEAAPPSRHAEVRVVWTDKSLLVRFVCRQDEPPLVNANPQRDQKTIGLWDRDVCEIFLAPDAHAPKRYFEFEAAPTGEWVDLAINFTPAGRRTDFDFHSGMTAAANVGKDRTIVAMSIPWSASIPKPQAGDGWRVNLFRCVGAGNERFLAWQPTFAPEPNFHVPAVFGWLRFV